MSRFELTLDPTYVPHWDIQDALRELIQNALDESIINEDNSMTIDREKHILYIRTKNASLSKSSLLIGASSKRENNKTIGKEGEGYKLACLVLIRSGFPVIIHNYSEREKWTPKIIKSRRYNSKLMVMDTEKYIWTTPPDHDLTFEVRGITDEIWDNLVKRTLHLQVKKNELHNESVGSVILDKEEARRIYVNGLYVTTIKDENLKYGYNINPDKIPLDRDRRAVSDFDLTWQTSYLWSLLKEENKDLIDELIEKGNSDIKWIDNFSIINLQDRTYLNFREKYGNNKIPVTTQEEYENVLNNMLGVEPIIVNEIQNKLVSGSGIYKSFYKTIKYKDDNLKPIDHLKNFKNKFKHNFSTDMLEEFNYIIEKSEDWK